MSAVAAETLAALLAEAFGGTEVERRWVSGDGAAVLVTPTPSDVVDEFDEVVITVHPAGTGTFSAHELELTDRFGSTTRAVVSARNQARVLLGALGPWRVRVLPQRTRIHVEVNRQLAMAAAAGRDEFEYCATSSDGSIVAVITESAERHLVVDVRGALPPTQLAAMRWQVERRSGEGTQRSLVTPLALDAAHAGYDLGPLTDVVRVLIEPVEIIDADALTADDVADTCAARWTGSARRVWRDWLVQHEPDDSVRALIERAAR